MHIYNLIPSVVILHIYTLVLIIISRRSFVITIICWLKREINSYTLYIIYTYVYLFYKYHNTATTSILPLNAIKIKVNKHQRKTLRQLKNMINTIYSNLVTISFSKKDNSHFFPIIILGFFFKARFYITLSAHVNTSTLQ